MASIACRIVACRASEPLEWDFYFVNDGPGAIDTAVLSTIDYEWGDTGSTKHPSVRLPEIAPGQYVHVWHDNGDGAEVRQTLSMTVGVGPRTIELQFDFPMLYKKTTLPVVSPLDRPGWAEAPSPGSVCSTIASDES